jgi:hypothetical protein
MCDGGWKYNFKNSNVSYKDNGIIKQVIISYTPKQNGIDKRKNQTFIKNMFVVLICCVIHVTTYEVGP